jgi:TatD DNase family protein
MDEMKACVEMGLYIGINGCSLKTTENLEVVKAIPADKLMLETDAPWCDIRPTHAGSSFVKTHLKSVKKEKWDATLLVRGRNEPCNIVQVLEVVASVRGDNQEELADQVFRNSHQVFLPNRL